MSKSKLGHTLHASLTYNFLPTPAKKYCSGHSVRNSCLEIVYGLKAGCTIYTEPAVGAVLVEPKNTVVEIQLQTALWEMFGLKMVFVFSNFCWHRK